MRNKIGGFVGHCKYYLERRSNLINMLDKSCLDTVNDIMIVTAVLSTRAPVSLKNPVSNNMPIIVNVGYNSCATNVCITIIVYRA